MSEKFCPSLHADSLNDSLNLQLKEIDSFNNSIQTTKDISVFYNHEAKKYKHKSKTY